MRRTVGEEEEGDLFRERRDGVDEKKDDDDDDEAESRLCNNSSDWCLC